MMLTGRLPALLLLVISGVVLTVVLWMRSNSGDPEQGEAHETHESAGEVTQENKVNPSEDSQWTSEEFAEAAGERLGQLLQLLEAAEPITADDLEGITVEHVQSTDLRPPDLQVRFSTEQLSVRHGSTESLKPAQGIEPLVAHLKLLNVPLEQAANIHSKSKLISVEQRSDRVIRTTAIVQRAGDTETGSLQQDAVWDCEWTTDDAHDEAPRLTSVVLKSYEESEYQSAAGHMFSDCTESVFQKELRFREQFLPGVDYWRSQTQKQYGVYPFGHHGISVGDVNNDGLDDLYTGQPSGLPNRLYLQNADGTVTDVAAKAGVDLLNRTQGVLLIDLDNDGDQDLVAVLDRLIIFMANDGDVRFTERNSVPTSTPGALSAADFDNDGDLDIYVVNYGDRFRSHPEIYHDANNGGPNVMLRNDGDWNFTDATAATGLNSNNTRWSFAASWEDFDDDGDQDLYVANDFGRNNLYRNDNGKFTDVASEYHVEDIAAGMSASWADYDHDGRMDLYVGNMFSSAGLRVTGQNRFQRNATQTIRDEFKRHARGNTLFRNTGSGTFEDVSVQAGVTVGRWAWASKFADLNNDSWEDLVVANGFVTSHQTKDL